MEMVLETGRLQTVLYLIGTSETTRIDQVLLFSAGSRIFDMAKLSATLEEMCAAPDEDFKDGPLLDGNVGQLLQKLQRLVREEKNRPGPDELVETLSKRSEELKTFFSQSPVDAIGQSPAEVEDSRLVDIFVSGGRASKTPQIEFRRFLAERSLAKNYHSRNPTRLDSMIKTKSFNLPITSHGSIRAFARTYFGRGREQAVLEAVTSGLRVLAVEAVNASASLILAFARQLVKSMTLQDIMEAFEQPELITLIANWHSWTNEVLICYDL